MMRALLALGIVAVLVGGALALGSLKKDAPSPDKAAASAKVPAASGAATPGKTGGEAAADPWGMDQTILTFEAEDFQAKDGPVETISVAEASGGKAITIPEGPNQTERNPQWKTPDGKPLPKEALKDYKGELAPNGWARYTFKVAAEGKYYLWARHYWPHSCADSFMVKIDDGPAQPFYGDTTTKNWKWGQPRKNAEPVSLSAGEHTLMFMNREDGMQVDKFLMTTDSPDAWVPMGRRGN